MDRFVKRANIAHFERLLERTTDASRRQVILTLLAEEKQKVGGRKAEELLHIRPQRLWHRRGWLRADKVIEYRFGL